MRVLIEVDAPTADEELALIDAASGWEDVQGVEEVESRQDRLAAETVLFVIAIIVGAAYAAAAIAQAAAFIQDRFHRPVLVDLTGPEPRTIALPAEPGLIGKTFVKSKDGERVEVTREASGPEFPSILAKFLG